MQISDILIINSYAGSLTIAAAASGLPIRGSYEDEGYGLDIQRANFPGLNYLAKFSQWPKQDLSYTVVLAHPPCAAFSQQNSSKAARGTDAKKFQCTVQVLKYAMENGCAALAIESVPAALEGARAVHEEYATRYGYQVFRVEQNAITFGIPQWRPRFWVLFVRGQARLSLRHVPKFRSVGQIIEKVTDKQPEPKMGREFEEQMSRLTSDLGFKWNEAKLLLAGDTAGCGGLPAILKRWGQQEKPIHPIASMDSGEIAKRYCVGGNFMSHCLRVLDPDSFATTLLFDSWWACHGRQLSPPEYCALMGFPETYIFPDKYKPKFREFLSRGVCPPVAKWVLGELYTNLAVDQEHSVTGPDTRVLDAGQTLDLNIKKGDFLEPHRNLRGA